MKLTRKSNKKQQSRKWKRTNKFSKENDEGVSKDKEIKCFNYGGLGHFATNCSSFKDIKKFMKATWRDKFQGKWLHDFWRF